MAGSSVSRPRRNRRDGQGGDSRTVTVSQPQTLLTLTITAHPRASMARGESMASDDVGLIASVPPRLLEPILAGNGSRQRQKGGQIRDFDGPEYVFEGDSSPSPPAGVLAYT